MQADDRKAGGPGWYSEPAVPAPERPRLLFDLDVEVCVVGGGLAGLTVAREVARRGWSVAVLEAQTIGSGASGRNLGFVLPGFLESIDRIIDRVGLDNARRLWALSEAGVEYIRRTISETNMPGVRPGEGWLQVAKFREDSALTEQAKLLRDEFGAEVEAWPAEHVNHVLRSPLYHNAIYFPRAFHVHPLNYISGLAAGAEQAGVRIFEHTPALSLDPAGIRKRVGTPAARVRAGHVVLAANTGLGALLPRVAASLLPVTSYVATTAPLGDKLKEAVTYTGGVSDTDFIDNHYRIVDGNRLVFNGGMTMWEADPRRYARRLARDIRRAFPQLGDVKVDHVWSGTAGSAVHKMPQIGEIARGLWLSGGYGGQGFNTSAVAGDLIARGIIEGDETWRLFSPYDLVWAGGAPGRAAMQALYWARRVRERLDAQLSRPAEMHQEEAPASRADSVTVADHAGAPPPAVEEAAPTDTPEVIAAAETERPSESQEAPEAPPKRVRKRAGARAAAKGKKDTLPDAQADPVSADD